MSLQLLIPHTERWWLAARRDLPWLTDPDVEDGHQRWPDRHERPWARIAATVATVGAALASGDYETEPDDPDRALLTLPTDGFDEADRRILHWWFRAGAEAPCADPWSDVLTNGRHRLWTCWEADPSALLPVSSAILQQVDEVPYMDADFEADLHRSAARGVESTPAGVAARNPRYMDALRHVANLSKTAREGVSPA